MTQIIKVSGTTVTIPGDWNTTVNTLEAIGGGGNGDFGSTTRSAGGGGGAAYAIKSNIGTGTTGVNPGDVLTIVIPGAGAKTTLKAQDNATIILAADFGKNGSGANAGGAGLIANNIPLNSGFAGGAGGPGQITTTAGGGSGGGSAGPIGAGKAGATGNAAGGGGGGGGSNGGTSSTGGAAGGANGGAGGNGTGGTGSGAGGTGAALALAGTVGGGGGGGSTFSTGVGATGGTDTSIDGSHGASGGGGGGGAGTTKLGGVGGTYGGGGGGGGLLASVAAASSASGGQGILWLTYVAQAALTGKTLITSFMKLPFAGPVAVGGFMTISTRGRAPFIPALLMSALATARTYINATGSWALAVKGKTATQAQGASSLSGAVPLTGRASPKLKAKGGIVQAAVLSAIGMIATTARAALSGKLALRGTTAIKINKTMDQTSGIVFLAGRTISQAKVKGIAALNQVVSFFGTVTTMRKGRAAPSGILTLTAKSRINTSAFAKLGRAGLSKIKAYILGF